MVRAQFVDSQCEGCGVSYTLLPGRGMNKRVMCYICQPIGGDRKITDRNKHMKHKYGITLAEFGKMYKKQDGKCAICTNPIRFTGDHMKAGATCNGEDPCVDHDHETGAVRGLLCFRCNTALGHVRDDVNILKSMINYLEA